MTAFETNSNLDRRNLSACGANITGIEYGEFSEKPKLKAIIYDEYVDNDCFREIVKNYDTWLAIRRPQCELRLMHEERGGYYEFSLGIWEFDETKPPHLQWNPTKHWLPLKMSDLKPLAEALLKYDKDFTGGDRESVL